MESDAQVKLEYSLFAPKEAVAVKESQATNVKYYLKYVDS